ncbi:MAG: bifunctional nuclease family protein [Dysgonamonadaceae bacterium]|jgi:bifunctional DNase/RNase|nr:bifunctional nuclease family protein [Dysgonamonadaceae bacterium]
MTKKRVKLQVLGITFSQIQTGAYALILEEEEGQSLRRIPIIIGTPEAQSIAIHLEGLNPPRPLTHDTFISFMNAFNIRLEEVFIHKFEDGVFFSDMLFTGGKKVSLDARTSDAIAIALRCGAPIYTTKDIILSAGVVMDDSEYDFPDDVSKRSPVVDNKTKEELQSRLENAIATEDYETASRIKEEINKRFLKRK